MWPEDQAIEPGAQIRFGLQIRRDPARHRNHGHQEPVAETKTRGNAGDGAKSEMLLDEKRHEVTQGNPGQNAGNAHGEDVETGIEGHEKAQAEDFQGPDGRRARGVAGRERERRAHDKEKERKDEVGGRPAIPGRVLERPVDVSPVARIVHQDHGRDGGPAERIDRHQALAVHRGDKDPTGGATALSDSRSRARELRSWPAAPAWP